MNYTTGNSYTNASRIALRRFYNHNQFPPLFINNMNLSYNPNQYNQLIPTITGQQSINLDENQHLILLETLHQQRQNTIHHFKPSNNIEKSFALFVYN